MTRHSQPSAPDVGSQKQRILGLYRERSDNRLAVGSGKPAKHKGFVGLTIIETSKVLGIPPHDVTHALYDMKKMGLVAFKESKSMGRALARGALDSRGSTPKSAVPVRIRITQRGIEMATPEDMNAPKPEEVDAARAELDKADLLKLDSNGPVKVIDLGLDGEITEGTADSMAEALAIPDAVADGVAETLGVNPAKAPEAILADLPVINALLYRSSKVKQAEVLLREAGLDDAADLVRGEASVVSQLEREVLLLLTRLGFDG